MSAEHGIGANQFGAGRVWSLLDMLRFNAAPFIEASRHLGQLGIAVLDPNVHAFHVDTVGYINGVLTDLECEVDKLGLPMAKRSIGRLREHINRPGVTPAQCREFVFQIQNRLTDEIDTKYLLCLTDSEAQAFDAAAQPLGQPVSVSFPSAAYDIAEAAKCLALGRSTAGAFHAIRALEAALRALTRCLALPDPTVGAARSWFNILRSVDDEVRRRWPTNVDRSTGDGRFFEEAHAGLAAMQNPYRNATMHLDQKYTEEEATDVFAIVGAFMRKLASRMDEDGLPLA